MADTTLTDAQVAGVITVIDTSAATPEALWQVAGFYHDKARRDVEAAVENFREEPFVYIDATLGTQFPTSAPPTSRRPMEVFGFGNG
jgi:hypothetical protein